MTVGIVMTTANRQRAAQGFNAPPPGPNYLGPTLQALSAQGAIPEVFPTSPDVQWLRGLREQFPWLDRKLHIPSRKLNRVENGARAMCQPPACDWVLHLEDDVLPCADAMGSVERWLAVHDREDRRIALFWSRDVYLNAGCCGDHPADRLFGAVAVAMRRADAINFGQWATRAAPRWRSGTARLRGFDKMMRTWHRERYPKIDFLSASVPSFFQHIGVHSSLQHLWPRATDHWTSPTFNGEAYQ